jgi:hypothetical protein
MKAYLLSIEPWGSGPGRCNQAKCEVRSKVTEYIHNLSSSACYVTATSQLQNSRSIGCYLSTIIRTSKYEGSERPVACLEGTLWYSLEKLGRTMKIFRRWHCLTSWKLQPDFFFNSCLESTWSDKFWEELQYLDWTLTAQKTKKWRGSYIKQGHLTSSLRRTRGGAQAVR